MINLKVGAVSIENAVFTESSGLLGITYESEMTIASLSSLYDCNMNPEITILNEDGSISKVYKNHALTSIAIKNANSKRMVSVVLQISEANIDEVESLKSQIETMNRTIIEQADKIKTMNAMLGDARDETNTLREAMKESEDRAALAEERAAAAEERVIELETLMSAIEEGIANAA